MVVAMLLWYRRGVTGSLEVNVGRELRRKFSVSPSTFRRAIADLERRGLLTVQRRVGMSPRITILDPPVDAPP
jgi:DNA-binding MarR family transcriptional regulator